MITAFKPSSTGVVPQPLLEFDTKGCDAFHGVKCLANIAGTTVQMVGASGMCLPLRNTTLSALIVTLGTT